METTETLARFAAALTCDDIPARAKEACKGLLLDALACALAGHEGEELPQVRALAAALGRSEESSIIGGGRLSLAGATLLNGYLITAVTMCDVHRETATHVTPVIVPAALAIAERQDATGADLLAALAAGFETTTRIGIGLDNPTFRRRGWHGPGVIGPFGSAAAAGRLLGLESERMGCAFGLAGSQAAGTYAAWGTPTVKFHQCRGGLSGLLAALLAEQGFSATRQFLTTPDGGLYPTYCDGGQPEKAIEGLGERWELEQIGLRRWPSSARLQGIVTALFQLLGENADLDAGRVSRVRIAMSEPAFELHGIFPTFEGKFEAMLSAHYTAAAILHDRQFWLDQFNPERYNDPGLRRFTAEQVEVRMDPRLSGPQAVVEVEMAAGGVLSSRCEAPKGAPENPLSREDIQDKFRQSAEGWLSSTDIETVIDMIFDLEQLGSTRSLMQVLSSATSSGR